MQRRKEQQCYPQIIPTKNARKNQSVARPRIGVRPLGHHLSGDPHCARIVSSAAIDGLPVFSVRIFDGGCGEIVGNHAPDRTRVVAHVALWRNHDRLRNWFVVRSRAMGAQWTFCTFHCYTAVLDGDYGMGAVGRRAPATCGDSARVVSGPGRRGGARCAKRF